MLVQLVRNMNNLRLSNYEDYLLERSDQTRNFNAPIKESHFTCLTQHVVDTL